MHPMQPVRTTITGGKLGGIRSSAGYTLVELIVVSTIVGILLAVGVPSFRYVTSGNRVSSEINGLLGDLQFARAEAIKRGTTVSICASTDGATCITTGTSWKTGWLVFVDGGTNGTVDAGDTLLRVQGSFTSTDTLVSDNNIRFLSFSREGFMMNLTTGVTFTLHDKNSNSQFSRCLSGSIVGALATQRAGQTTLENAACT